MIWVSPVAVEERASACPMPPQPIKAIWILSLAETLAVLGWVASRGTLSPAPAAAVVKNSRLEVTLYFLSDEEAGADVAEVELELDELELSEFGLLLEFESEDDLAASFFSDEPPFSDELLSDEPFSEEPSPSFLPPPLPGGRLPLLA